MQIINNIYRLFTVIAQNYFNCIFNKSVQLFAKCVFCEQLVLLSSLSSYSHSE